MTNISSYCLQEKYLMFSSDPAEHILIGYLSLVVCIFGVLGNLVNLTVLTAPGISSRSNIILASLAVCDMTFLLLFTPHSLAHFRIFYLNYYFRLFYVKFKMPSIAVINWVSAAAIWFVLIVCLERLIVIRYPLKARKYKLFSWKVVIPANLILTGLLTTHWHFAYDCYTKFYCNGTQVHAMCSSIAYDPFYISKFGYNPNSRWLIKYVEISAYINTMFVVFIPVCVVALTNFLLMWTLKERRHFLLLSTRQDPRKDSQKSSSASATSAEQKIGITVCAIVTSFIITQGPSAIIQLVLGDVAIGKEKRAELRAVSTFMVILGKSLNFILFCLSSANFRQRLMSVTRSRLSIKASLGKSFTSGAENNSTMITTTESSCKRSSLESTKSAENQTGEKRVLLAPSSVRYQKAKNFGEIAKMYKSVET